MMRRGGSEQEPSTENSDGFKATKARSGRKSGKLRVMVGQPVEGVVDITALEAFIQQTRRDKEKGLIPHRGREGVETGETTPIEVRPYRAVRRRGTWKT